MHTISVTGKPLFVAPRGRNAEQFLNESSNYGWLSFRDTEVIWDNVRVIRGRDEIVSVDGTHLGHNFPDGRGNRLVLVTVRKREEEVALISGGTFCRHCITRIFAAS